MIVLSNSRVTSLFVVAFAMLLVLASMVRPVFAQTPTPDWELPVGPIVSAVPYYGNAFGQTNILLYNYGPVPLDVNADGYVDLVYKYGNTAYVELNTKTGWERVYDCSKSGGVYYGDCDYLNN